MRRLAAVLLLAAALGGCGTSEEQKAYVRSVDQAARGLLARHGVDRNLPADASAPALAKRVRGIQGVLRDLATRLDHVRPPAEARDAHRRYVSGLRGFADDLEPTEAALRRGDVRAARRGLDTGRALSRRTRADLLAAQERFKDLGYELNGLDIVPDGG